MLKTSACLSPVEILPCQSNIKLVHFVELTSPYLAIIKFFFAVELLHCDNQTGQILFSDDFNLAGASLKKILYHIILYRLANIADNSYWAHFLWNRDLLPYSSWAIICFLLPFILQRCLSHIMVYTIRYIPSGVYGIYHQVLPCFFSTETSEQCI